MTRNISIARRLMFRLLLVFALGPLIAVIVLMVEGSGAPNLRVDQEHERQADAIKDILQANANGRLVLPAAAMERDETLRDTRILVYSGASLDPVATWPEGLTVPNWQLRVGYQTVRNLADGRVKLLFPPRGDDWYDFWFWLRAELEEEDLPLLAILLAIMLPLAHLSVRRGLKPVRQLAQEAARIEPGQGNRRLSEEQCPVELLPLVMAINRSLDRIDTGFAAQRLFAARVAHELRNPLAVITARLERPLTADRRAEIRGDLRGMANLIQQLLTISELSARRLRTDADVDLSTIVREVVAKEAPAALRQGRYIEVKAPDWPVVVRGNAPAIATALRNLVENGFRHSPPGGVVSVRIDESEPCIEVADQGPGIPPEDKARVFEPFWRGGQTPGSAGLGLSIVKEMAELHGGSVTVDDNKPQGTVFRIKFRPGETTRRAPKSTGALIRRRPAA